MGAELFQDALVTLAAAAAAWTVLRRVFTAVKPAAGATPACASCPRAAAHAAAAPRDPESRGTLPLTVVR